ncbi:PAS domain S-box-containing protein [Neorhodopirellula lusitana]|uniref:histidine kinase n=1 Tax=Neorhodopirellula lusitana TaxID=445327 RepID=A0ABY1PPB8_9BACT|nr:CHASE domain-containing protein [Neorhodopirellula lusitana]SMP41065.1 PAS domain S-box-containing protein [Neorhodopirellula lusitana]
MRSVKPNSQDFSELTSWRPSGSTSALDHCVELLHNRAAAWGILAISLLLTGLAWFLTNRHVERRDRDRFEFRTAEVQSRIEERMQKYEQVLRDGTAFFAASENVSRQDWTNYIQRCEILERFPGIQAAAVSVVVPSSEVASHQAGIRAEGFPDYRLHPQGDRDLYSAIVYIEPFDWRNERAFGYDMYSEEVRHKAMERAARTGLLTVSGKITLIQETDQDVQAGVLCYLPIYQKNKPLLDEQSRFEALKGWVYAAFRLDDLMVGILGDGISDISFQIYDSVDPSRKDLLFDSHGDKPPTETGRAASFTEQRHLSLSGRDWTIELSTKPEFFNVIDSSVSPTVAVLGLLIDILLFVVISSIGRQRSSAIKLAERMTNDFKESESRIRSILENATDAILSVAANGEVMAANEAAGRMFLTADKTTSVKFLNGHSFDLFLNNQTFAEIVAPEKTSDTPSSINQVEISLRCCRDDGSRFPCRMSIGAVDGNGGYIVIARDETSRIASENELAETNRQLVSASRKAGMAEVASGVLHNVGNSLNGVNTSSSLIATMLDDCPIQLLLRAVNTMNQNRENLGDYLTNDDRGKRLPDFIEQVSAALLDCKEKLTEETYHLRNHISHINQIIRIQQDQASSSNSLSDESATELMSQAELINLGRHSEYDIAIERNFNTTAKIMTDRTKVLQILVNLIANAQDAVREVTSVARTIELSIKQADGNTYFTVSDNGPGIPADVLPRIQEFGFTTKSDGHGFGLHSSVAAAQTLGGELQIGNNPSGIGACFALVLPISVPQDSPTDGHATFPLTDVSVGDHHPAHV